MKSKIIFSTSVIFVFLSALGTGIYDGMAAVSAPSVCQLWAGAIETAAGQGVNNTLGIWAQ